MTIRHITLLTAILVITVTAFGQNQADRPRTVGITAMLTGSQLDIMVPFSVSQRWTIAPSVGYVHVADMGSDYRLGMKVRVLLTDGTVAPFLGLGGTVIIAPRTYTHAISNQGPETMTESRTLIDGIAGVLGGAEYTVNRYFSLGIEGALNATISDKGSNRFGNAGKVNGNTATSVYMSLYF